MRRDGLQEHIVLPAERALKLILAKAKLHLGVPVEVLASICPIVIIEPQIEGKVDHFYLSFGLDEVDASLWRIAKIISQLAR